jgi:hypothetical protein
MRFAMGPAAALALAFAAPAFAQAPATPVKLSLGYDGRLIIKVLDIHLQEQATPGDYGASASLRSYGLLAAFKTFNVKASAHGRIEDGAVRPEQFSYDNRDGERERRVRVAWRADDVAMTSSPSFSNLGQPPASREQKLVAADPLTQLIRFSLAASPGEVCMGAPRFFDGKQLYALEFGPGEPLTPSAQQRALGLTSAVRCAVRYREIAGFKPKKAGKPDKGLRSQISIVFGQLGDAGPWVIATITADTFLGPAVIELKHVSSGPDVAVAQDWR